MDEKYDKKVDPGRCGGVTPHASKGGQRLLLEFETGSKDWTRQA
jgi:hypothetical protein